MGRGKRKTSVGGGSGRFFPCFGGASLVDVLEEEQREGSVGWSSSSSSCSVQPPDTAKKAAGRIPKHKSHRRVLSKIVRSVFFVSFMERGGRVGKDRLKYLERKISEASSEGSSGPSISRSMEEDERGSSRVFSSSSSRTSSSSSSSSSTSSSSSSLFSTASSTEPSPRRPTRLKPPPKKPGNYGWATALWLLILSLFMMVFCGRLCSILWTSTCLFFAPRRSCDVVSPPSDVSKPELRPTKGWDEYEKKRVILDGLLQRKKKV